MCNSLWGPSCARIIFIGFLVALVLGHGMCSVISGEIPVNATWQSTPTYRMLRVQPSPASRPGFSRIPPEQSGLHFSNGLKIETAATNRLLEIGSGVAAGDVDGDGRADLYFCSIEGANSLYRNVGNWRFEEIAGPAGVSCPGQKSIGAAFVDLDGDHDLDLLVTSLGNGTRLFLNDGKGRFTDDLDRGLIRRLGATSMALGDLDGDGDLDLYVANYRTDTFFDQPPGLRTQMRQEPGGKWVLEPRSRFMTLPMGGAPPLVLERGEPDIFYLNLGKGKFVPVPWTAGVFATQDGQSLSEPPTDWGLSAMFRDLNGDLHPDLYVCNDFINWPDRVWFNHQGNQLRAAPVHAFRASSVASMAVDVADINRDGVDDVLTVDMLNPRRDARFRQRPDLLAGKIEWPLENPEFSPEVPRNTLHLGRGDGSYAEIAAFAGVAATDWSPSAVFIDVDLDGWEDLLVATGNLHDVQDIDALQKQNRPGTRTTASRLQELGLLPDRRVPSMAFRNRGNLTFVDMSSLWGFNAVGVAHGMALVDLDQDGDQDVVINCMNEPARVYRNDAVAPRVAVRLNGEKENTKGIGARITVRGGPVTQSQEMVAGGRYASSDDPVRVFATGHAKSVDIDIAWRDGRRSLLNGVEPNCIIEVFQSTASSVATVGRASSRAGTETSSTPTKPLFADVTDLLKHTHTDAAYADFSRQPLIPFKLSTAGPGLAWADMDGDGDQDLVIGSGRGGRLELFKNQGGGKLESWTNAISARVNDRDNTAVLIHSSGHGSVGILVGESNWEDGAADAPAYRVYSVGRDPPDSGRPGHASGPTAVGPMAQADVDLDGDLDLFVGGRTRAQRYPESATSVLLKRNGSDLEIVQEFENLGLVNGAVFTDYDADGDPDLALACAWDAIRLFKNQGGSFVEVTDAVALSAHRGLWNGIVAADFDNDGLLDLAASNWGLNWRTDQSMDSQHPVLVFFGEFAGDGIVHPVMASLDAALGFVTPWRERKAMVAALPFLAAKFPDHRSYSMAALSAMIGTADQTHQRSANALASMVFLNRRGKFEARMLPSEAQFSPSFGICAADFNGDGNEDLFMAQNFFGGDAESPRFDAGVGLVLLGDGTGGFRALKPTESGIAAFGEQRGSALADFDEDGRVDLAFGQNSGPTRLFRNQAGKPGLRVRVNGPDQNPWGIGCVLRLGNAEKKGPAREIQGGSGWYSQNSAVQVLGLAEPPTQIQVRWPGGRTTIIPIPSGAKEIFIDAEGSTGKLE